MGSIPIVSTDKAPGSDAAGGSSVIEEWCDGALRGRLRGNSSPFSSALLVHGWEPMEVFEMDMNCTGCELRRGRAFGYAARGWWVGSSNSADQARQLRR